MMGFGAQMLAWHEDFRRALADLDAAPLPTGRRHPPHRPAADAVAADPESAGSLLLTGTTWTGKTYEAYGALRRIAEAGPRTYEVISITAADLYGRLRPKGSERGTEEEPRRLCRVPLLLLDDLGSAKASEWTE
ncbi:hypothetical protein [Streptomyces sp. NPDC060198]|uniref:hypothetical protein n=1 Tax=Streptomyces sp. NPDC060198 TaxID=3347070 RepID=UPI00364EB22F